MCWQMRRKCHMPLYSLEENKMLKLGQYQKLTIVKKVEFGVYLAEEQDGETCASSGKTGSGECKDRG